MTIHIAVVCSSDEVYVTINWTFPPCLSNNQLILTTKVERQYIFFICQYVVFMSKPRNSIKYSEKVRKQA
jgi:hypothetical protein